MKRGRTVVPGVVAGLVVLALAGGAKPPVVTPPPDAPAADGSVVERWIVPAGREPDVLALLAPMGLLKRSQSGQWLKDAGVEGTTVTLTVTDAEGGAVVGRVTLRRINAATIEVRGEEAVSPALVEELRGVVMSKPVETWPWVRPPSATVRPGSTGHSASDGTSSWPLLLPGLMAVLLLLLAAWQAGRGRAWRVFAGGEGRFEAWALVVITVAAVAVRLALSPRSFMHEYYHIVDFMHDALYRDDGFFHYGGGGPVLFRAWETAFGGTEEAVFRTNLVLASLTVPVVGAFVGVWAGGAAGVLAAGLVAFAPVHLRFSGSEELTIAGLLWSSVALASASAWWRGGSRTWLAVAALALGLGLHTRPELLVFPAVVAGVLPAERGGWKRLVSWPALLAVVVLGVIASPRVMFLLESPKDTPSLVEALKAFVSRFVLFDLAALPVVWLVLVVAGIAGWLRRGRIGLVAWGVGASVALALLGLAYFQNPAPYSWRVQLVVLPFLGLLAAGALEWMPEGSARRRWLATGFVLVAAAGLVQQRAAVTTLGDQQVEYAFVKSLVKDLPSPAKLLAVREQTQKSLDAFPIFLLEEARKAVEVVDLDSLRATGEWPSPDGDVPLLYYEGMPCYFGFRDEVLPVPRHARCDDVRQRYALEPIATTVIDAPPYSPLNYAPGPWTVGLYRLKRAPPPP